MVQIKFVVNGAVQLSRNLRVAATQIQDMGSFFKEAIQIVEDRTDDIFNSRGSNVQKNPKRRALSARTVYARSTGSGYYRNKPNRPGLMRWTGRLQDDRTKAYNKESAVLRFNAPYAIHHQNGGKNLPRRAIIDLDNGTNTKIVKALQQKIQDSIGIFNNQT